MTRFIAAIVAALSLAAGPAAADSCACGGEWAGPYRSWHQESYVAGHWDCLYLSTQGAGYYVVHGC